VLEAILGLKVMKICVARGLRKICMRVYKPYHNVVQKQIKANRGRWKRYF